MVMGLGCWVNIGVTGRQWVGPLVKGEGESGGNVDDIDGSNVGSPVKLDLGGDFQR